MWDGEGQVLGVLSAEAPPGREVGLAGREGRLGVEETHQ